jgi:2-oxoglutarate ferredoxin oxidoreductase subunit alpha
MQSRWGTHGDYSAIVLSPNSVQELFTLTIRAFNLAEKYRTPVILLADEITAHMREQLILPPLGTLEIVNRKKPKAGDEAFFGLEEVPPMPSVGEDLNVVVTGSTHDEYGIRVTADPIVHRRLVERLNNKIQNHVDELTDYESYNVEDCQVGIVSYGCTSRSNYEAAENAQKKGIKTGFIRLRTLWPFPERIIKKMAETAEAIIVPEMNLKQLFYEVERAAEGRTHITPLNRIGGGELITPEELLAKILEVKKQND